MDLSDNFLKSAQINNMIYSQDEMDMGINSTTSARFDWEESSRG